MLVPEIALTPGGRRARSAQAFGERVAIQHSGLSDGERHDQWQRIRRGDVDVVVGTRSAVFAPLAALGLIVVDEEHDGSYKQEESPRYQRPRRRRRARRSAGGRAGRARLGDAVARELSQRADRPLRRSSRSSGACSIGRWPTVTDRRHARGVRGRRARTSILSARAARGDRRPAGAARAGDRAAEPPRLRHARSSAGSAARRSSARTAACR